MCNIKHLSLNNIKTKKKSRKIYAAHIIIAKINKLEKILTKQDLIFLILCIL